MFSLSGRGWLVTPVTSVYPPLEHETVTGNRPVALTPPTEAAAIAAARRLRPCPRGGRRREALAGARWTGAPRSLRCRRRRLSNVGGRRQTLDASTARLRLRRRTVRRRSTAAHLNTRIHNNAVFTGEGEEVSRLLNLSAQLKRNWNKVVLKFCFSLVSLLFQLCGRFYIQHTE